MNKSSLSYCSPRLGLAGRREGEGFLLLAEVFECKVDHVSAQLLSARLLHVLSKITVSHLEELVHKDFDLLCHLAVADEGVCSHDASLEEDSIVRGTVFVQFLDELKDLIEAMIEKHIGLALEVIVPNEDAVV